MQKNYGRISALNLYDFTELIKSFIIQNYEIEKFIKKNDKKDKSESVAKRLITGKSAEEYFKMNYLGINHFRNYDLTDTTNFVCGFDFKSTQSTNFYCVEVKGLNLNSGSIMMAEKDIDLSDLETYCKAL